MSHSSDGNSEAKLNGRAVSLTIVAFLLGALAAGGVSVRVIREVKTVEDATSLPPSNIAPAEPASTGYHIDPNETLISSTALVPIAVAVQDGQVAINYDLTSLAPQLGAVPPGTRPAGSNETLASIYPRTWVLETSGGLIEGGTTNVVATTAMFDVDVGFSATDIESVTVTDALAPFPIEIPFVLSDATPVVDIGFGFTVQLLRVTEQAQTSTVQVDVVGEDAFQTGLRVVGAGPGWAFAAPNREAGSRTTLIWSSGDLPDEISLRAVGVAWLPIDGEYVVTLDGGP